MKKEIDSKLWVVKFCLKVVYPKLNCLAFLVYLAVKYRKQYLKTIQGDNMDTTYKIIPISQNVQRLLATQMYLVDKECVILHKCLIISRNQFIDLASENFFYLDNGVLWVKLKLSCQNLKKFKEKQNNNNKLKKYKLNFVKSEVHKKLWDDCTSGTIQKCRIVPVIGSKNIGKDVVATSENEFHNIASSLGLETSDDIEISFSPVPYLESAPLIASTAEVSLIVNDYDLSNDFIKEVLNNYFEVPKLMHLNDIFSIDLTPEITVQYHYKYADLIELAGKLYFKCEQLTSGSENKLIESIDQAFFIVKAVTQLRLSESIHDIRPRDAYFNFQKANKNAGLITSCPFGFKKLFTQIQENIQPFISGELNDLSSSLSSPIIPMLLLTGLLGSGRHILVKTLAKYNGMNCLQIDCNALQSSTAKQTESKLSATIQRAKAASPVIVLLDNFEVFAVDPENNEDCRLIEYFENSLSELYENYTKHTIIFIAVTERVDLKPNILRIFLDKFHIPKLNLQQRYEVLEWFVSVMGLEFDIINQENSKINVEESSKLSELTTEILRKVAAKTETFKYGDLDTLLHFALREAYFQKENNTNLCSPDPADMHQIQEHHFESALESMRSLQSQNLDAPKIPKVYWEDIGGLDHLKKELLKTIEFPIKYPHLFKNSSLKRSGILLYGPPGCGKTLVAKAVSTELNVSFLSVKGPELLNMYIGQSEENVRRVFESARASSPCIVFLDEVDAVAGRRGAAGDSGGAADRLVSQLLAEVDGVSTDPDEDSSSFVFIIGATNRPDLLERSLLRPGRLDKLVYVGPYCGLDEKTKVLTSLCRRHKLSTEVNLEQVAGALPERCTGADLSHVVSTARAAAVRGLVAKLHTGQIKESDLSPDSVVIGASDIRDGVDAFRASVTDEELAYYESLQNQM